MLYPVTARVSSFVMDVTWAQTYLFFFFVHHGVVLNSRKFSTILQHYTEKYLGVSLGLRSYHQVMCSMLCCLAWTDYGSPDEEDKDLTIHLQFGHSSAVADTHYSIQATNTLASISHTSVSAMQHISLWWHLCLGHLHPHASDEAEKMTNQNAETACTTLVKGQFQLLLQEDVHASIQEYHNSIAPHWISILQGFSSHFTPSPNPTFQPTPPSNSYMLQPFIIHPQLASRLKPMFPGMVPFSFTCSQ